jgi:diguanylate cyclase (GGDEF)-like protein
MHTSSGERRHSLDIRRTRHPLNGDFLFLVVEYDFTELYNALAEVEAARAKLHNIAMHDTLTGAHSLHYMQQAAKTELAHAKRHQQQRYLLFIDLDGFKAVNDQLGHDAGDAVLRETAQRIQQTIRAEDLLARIGGDEFALLLAHNDSDPDSHIVADRLLTTLQQPFEINGQKTTISASMGLACYPQHGNHLDALLKAADNAMYCVKKHGKNGFALATRA